MSSEKPQILAAGTFLYQILRTDIPRLLRSLCQLREYGRSHYKVFDFPGVSVKNSCETMASQGPSYLDKREKMARVVQRMGLGDSSDGSCDSG